MPEVNALFPNLISSPVLAAEVKPFPVDEEGVNAPANSEVRKIAEDLLGGLKYSFASVLANPNAAVRPNSVESLFKQAAEKLEPAKRDRYRRVASELVSAPDTVKTAIFGRAAERSAEEHIGAAGGFERYDEGLAPLAIDRKLLGIREPTLTVPRGMLRATSEGLLVPAANLPGNFENFQQDFEDASAQAQETGVVSDDRLGDIWGHFSSDDVFSGTTTDEFEEFAVTDKMGFWVTRVKCADETNPEWWGSDEIALAGVTVDETGDTKKIAEKFIGGGFDDGDSKSYSNWRYTWFSMREGQYWPKTYIVTLLLAEKDYGGLSNILNDLWEKVGAKVKEKISAAVAGVLTPYLGAAIAKVIGEAVAWIVNALVGWIINAFKDDVFPPFIAKVTTPSMSARWNYPNGQWGNPSSGIRTAHFYGHGGHYLVNYYWKFFA